ncbi:MAG: glycosyltransferase family 4 protein [Desulfuromonadaceae bacterium]
MKILHTVEFYYPSVGGMQEVVRQLSESLIRLGHIVTVATSYLSERKEYQLNGVEIKEFSITGKSATGIEGDVSAYEHFLLESQYDIVVNFAAQQWATDIALPLLPQIAGRKIFVPTGFSGLYSRSYQKYFRQLPEFMRQYDMNVFLSDSYRDISFAREHNIAKTILIPNGASAAEFLGPVTDIRSQLGIVPDHFLILHVGSHTGSKGHKEAMEIFRQTDIRNVTLLIVGNEPSGGCGIICREYAVHLNESTQFLTENKRIVVTTLTRPETVSAYHAADLFLFPSNIECSPIVLFECMASRTPFLVTDVGNSSEIIEWSGGAGVLLPSDKPTFLPRNGTLRTRIVKKLLISLGRSDDFTVVRANILGSVELLEKMYLDVAKREEMGHAGFLAWQKRFSWEKIAGEYEALYRNLLEGNV